MAEGWVRIHRQIWENPLWFSERFTRMQAWIDLILLASHKPHIVYIRGNEVKVKRGQLAWAAEVLGQRWQWDRKTVVRYLESLEKQGMIVQQKSRVITVVTINKYDYYQTEGQQNGQQNGQQTPNRKDTNNKDNNGKNEKNTYVCRPETEALYKAIAELCTKYGITNSVNKRALDVLVERYVGKIHMKVELQHCLSWLISKKFTSINDQRLGNWFKKAQEIQKRDQLKQMERKEAEINPAMAQRRERLKSTDGFHHDQSVQDFSDAQ